MGSSLCTCKDTSILTECIDSKAVDFDIINIKKNFIKSKCVNQDETDNKFYKKVILNESKPERNIKQSSHIINFERMTFEKIKNDFDAFIINHENVNLSHNRKGIQIKRTSMETCNGLGFSTKMLRSQLNSINDMPKKEYYNGSIKVILFNDRTSLKNIIRELNITENFP